VVNATALRQGREKIIEKIEKIGIGLRVRRKNI
jgi:hypothetical protein